MSRFSKYVREKVVKVLVTALVVGSVAGNEGIAVQAAGADLNDPFSFVLYTNEFVSSNLDHIEGNAAIKELKVSMVSYGGKSYLGDLSAPNQILKYTASGRTDEKELIIPLTNSDGTQNSVEREVTGQGYNIIAGENKLYTGNLLKNCEVWDTDIASEISNVLAGNMVQKSKDLYAMANEDSDTQLVLNVTSAELNTRMEDYDKEITGAAFYGKTVVVNVSDSGTVNITGWMNAHGAKKQALEHQLWADRIIWNFGNATEVNVNSIFGYILAPNATVMSWRGVEGGLNAAKAGHNAIMTPMPYAYLDFYQEDPAIAPTTIGGYTTLKKTYSYNPAPDDADELVKKHVIGIQGNIWREYMKNSDRTDYQAFPRAMAIAETGWTLDANIMAGRD